MSANTEQVLTIQKIRATSIYKLLFCGMATFIVPLSFLLGVAGYFGAATVKWNAQPIYGLEALFLAPLASTLLMLIFIAIVGTFTCLGLSFFACFRPLKIRVVMAQTITD